MEAQNNEAIFAPMRSFKIFKYQLRTFVINRRHWIWKSELLLRSTLTLCIKNNNKIIKLIQIKWIAFLFRHKIDLSEKNYHTRFMKKQMYKITHFSKLKTNIIEFSITCIRVLFRKYGEKNCKGKIMHRFNCFVLQHIPRSTDLCCMLWDFWNESLTHVFKNSLFRC